MSRLVVGFVAAMALATAPASACSCGPVSAEEVVASAALLFDGTVLDRRIDADRAGHKAAVLRIRVTRMLKGARPRSGIMVLDPPWSPALCGVGYDAGHSGRYAAVLMAGGPYTASCTQLALDRALRAPGLIGLKHESGTWFGPWPAGGGVGQGGVPNVDWSVRPDIVLPADRYIVFDSDPDTWTHEAPTHGQGIHILRGRRS